MTATARGERKKPVAGIRNNDRKKDQAGRGDRSLAHNGVNVLMIQNMDELQYKRF